MQDFHRTEAAVKAAAGNSPHSLLSRPPRGYFLTVHGISKKYTSPEDLQQRAEGILRERFRVFPEVEEFVREVVYLLDAEGDMAVLFFDSELSAELLLEVCCDEATSPLSIAGKRFTLNRGYRESKQFLRFADEHLLKSPEKVLYLGGVPEKWEDKGKIEAHFNGILENDFSSKLVTTVHILPAAAYVQFTAKSAIDRLFYHCEQDARLVTDIGQKLVLCYGVKFVPFLRSAMGDSGQGISGVSDVSSANCQDATKLVLPEQEQSSRAFHTKMPNVHVDVHIGTEKLRADETRQPSSAEPCTTQGHLQTAAVSNASNQMEWANRWWNNAGSREKRRIDLSEQATEDVNCREANRNQINVRAAPRAVCPTDFMSVQQCVMVGGFKRSDISVHKLKIFLQSLIRKYNLSSGEAECRIEWDHARDAALVMLASEDMANGLMSIYVRTTQDFSLDGAKFWLSRPEGYRRQQAVYREGASSGATKVIIFNMSRLAADEEQQFKEALLEVVETAVMRSGVLEQNKSPLKDVFYRGSITYAVLDAAVARALLQHNRLFVFGRALDIRESPAQTILHIVNLPSATSRYDPYKLKQILRDAIRKMQPNLSLVDSITSVNWEPSETRARVYLQSEAVADAIMAAYVLHTHDFCLPELPLTIFRHNCYVRPGTVFRNRNLPLSRSCEVMLAEIPQRLDPVPLAGAVAELVHRELAGKGVLEQGERVIRRCYWKTGDHGAKLTVDEIIGEKLLALGEVILAGVPMKFSPVIPQVVRTGGTGGWIEEDEA